MAKRQRRRRQERRQEHSKRPGWRTRHSVITGAGLAAGAALGMASGAQAAATYYYVGSNGDTTGATDCDVSTNTDCTLRDAVYAANANSGYADTIFFESGITGTISLTTASGGQIPITDGVYIYGPGPDLVTVQAAPNSRLFDVDPDNAGDRVEIDGLTLTGGNVTGNGGAIQNDDARLRIIGSVLSGNTASGTGGAIYEPGNYDNGYDDAIFYSTFSDNHADAGGGLYANIGWGLLRSTTFSGNTADAGDGGAVNGGGGYLIDSTVSGNQATADAGGMFAGQISLFGTILANNTGSSNPDLYASCAGPCYAGYDLVEDPGASGIGVVSTVITGQDPQLGGLGLNGGYTPTLKPAASSPVVDQSYSYSYTDQRFFDRTVDNPNKPNVPGGNGADIGSVELTLAEGPQATPPTPAPAPTPLPRKKKKCKKKKHRAASAKKKKCKKKKKRSLQSGHGFRFANPPKSVPRWPDAAEHQPFRLRP